MQTTITARQIIIPDALKTRATGVVARLAKRAMRPTSAHITFGREAQLATAEVVLKAARGTVHVARAEAPDPRTAFDRASAKLRRQLDKLVEAPAHRGRKAAAR